jgi:hypothetical protein
MKVTMRHVKQVFGVAKWLARPNDGRIIAKRTGN